MFMIIVPYVCTQYVTGTGVYTAVYQTKYRNVYNYFSKFIHTCTGILVPVRVPVSSSIKRYIRYQPKINERIIFYCRRVYKRMVPVPVPM